MTSGGARNRSGPPADPNSFRSAAKGVVLTGLPSEGYKGDVPEFPVPDVEGRVLSVWADLWRTPQAAAWALQSWRWTQVADLARLMVLSEDSRTPMGVWTNIRQARADLGLTPAGLLENGWKIATDELSEKRAATPSRSGPSAKERLAALANGA